jgi:hypothetical protein
LGGALVLATLCTTQLGCVSLVNPGPTAVSQREIYEPGVAEYDTFFARFHALQLAVVKAPTEHWALRKALATELGLDPMASMDLVEKHLATRISDFEKHDSRLRVELIGLEEGAKETDAVVTLTDASGKEVESPLVDTLERAAKSCARLSVMLRSARQSAEQLGSHLSELDANVGERFRLRGPLRTKEVRRNLADVRVMLPTLARAVDSADEENRRLLEMVTKLATEEPSKSAASKSKAAKPASAGKGPSPTKPKSDGYEP